MLFTGIVPQFPDPDLSWLSLAMSSTLAGNLTILGSIADLIVVEGARRRGVLVSFLDDARIGVPITVLTLAFGIWWLS
jgi:Na+/H+ antiporter NhaD/arsenite permease-like protein